MPKWAWVSVLVGSVLALFAYLPTGAGQPAEEELWRHRHIGKALFETPTRIAEATTELKKALDLAPNSFRDRLNYGLALLRAEDLKAAVTELEKAQKQNPALPHAWFNLGIAYKRLGGTRTPSASSSA
jgi:predicted Zn-dependent protease